MGQGFVAGKKLCLNIKIVLFWKIHDDGCPNLEMLGFMTQKIKNYYDSVNIKRDNG